MMATRKETAALVVDGVLAGEDMGAARQRVAAEHGRQRADVDLDFKAARYLVVNEHDTAHPLLDDPPPDVVIVRYRWGAEHEPNRVRLFRDMDVPITALPCLVVWEEEQAGGVDEDDNPTVIPAGFRAHRAEGLPPSADPWVSLGERFPATISDKE